MHNWGDAKLRQCLEEQHAEEDVEASPDLPERWEKMHTFSRDAPNLSSAIESARLATASAGCSRMSLGVLLSMAIVVAFVVTSSPPPEHRSSRFRQLVATKSLAAHASGVLKPLVTNGGAAVRDDSLGVTFLVSFADAPEIESQSIPPPPQQLHDPLSAESREADLEVLCGTAPNTASIQGIGKSSVRHRVSEFVSSVTGVLSLKSSASEVEGDTSPSAVLGSQMLGGLLNGFGVVLNKFPTLPGHLLVVTDTFEEQGETPLTAKHLNALFVVVDQLPGVGFFNSGSEAGASQPHRHLQALPLDVLQDLGTYLGTSEEARQVQDGTSSNGSSSDSEKFSTSAIISGGSSDGRRFSSYSSSSSSSSSRGSGSGSSEKKKREFMPPIDELLSKYTKVGTRGSSTSAGSSSTFTQRTPRSVAEFPFVHAFVALPHTLHPSAESGRILERAYRSLLDHCAAQLFGAAASSSSSAGDTKKQEKNLEEEEKYSTSPPLRGVAYNLLMTSTWMLLVPRTTRLSAAATTNTLAVTASVTTAPSFSSSSSSSSPPPPPSTLSSPTAPSSLSSTAEGFGGAQRAGAGGGVVLAGGLPSPVLIDASLVKEAAAKAKRQQEALSPSSSSSTGVAQKPPLQFQQRTGGATPKGAVSNGEEAATSRHKPGNTGTSRKNGEKACRCVVQ